MTEIQQVELRPIPSFPLYSAGSDGEIYGRKFHRPLKRLKSGNSQRYWSVNLAMPEGRKRRLVHCLIAEAFLGPKPKGCKVNHLDLDRSNCRPSNLEYTSDDANNQHAIDNGRIELKLTDAEVVAIAQSKVPQTELAAMYGVSRALIWHIKRGHRRLWGY